MSDIIQTFRKGDRVKRRIKLNEDRYRLGTVSEVYSTAVGFQLSYIMYAVLWDGDREPERNYFGGGLERA